MQFFFKVWPEIIKIGFNHFLAIKSAFAKPKTSANTNHSEHINQMPTDEWFTRHNKVSEADFAKEPHRNKLNIIINRTSHMSYHLGQMAYLEKNKAKIDV